MQRKNNIIIISGPTASGKTSTSISLAKELGGEIVNFDSLLFYKEINIGTAKPDKKELLSVPHHMVGNHSIYSPINAADYIKETIPVINECHSRGKTVFLVGGSGFYLQAILNGMYDSITTSDDIINKSEVLYKQNGISPFLDILKDVDSDSLKKYHENDHYRIRRAVEHYWMTGNKFSSSRDNMEQQKKDSPSERYNWNILHIHLDIPKDEHFKYILARTETMFKEGLLKEVKDLITAGAKGDEKPLKSIGYKEVIGFINGEYSTVEECMERISINTRRLAKSQRTWFKKVDKLSFNSITDLSNIKDVCREFLG